MYLGGLHTNGPDKALQPHHKTVISAKESESSLETRQDLSTHQLLLVVALENGPIIPACLLIAIRGSNDFGLEYLTCFGDAVTLFGSSRYKPDQLSCNSEHLV
jgi:hypothetical protein